MGIESGRGDLLKADVDALVNPVNTKGVMGKGLALQFKRAFPDAFAAYRAACEAGEVAVGRVHVVERAHKPLFIVNFPTKDHWQRPSRLEYVEAGLDDLVERVLELGIESIALPALGCGLGGLEWAAVRPLIVSAAERMPGVRVVVFEPASR